MPAELWAAAVGLARRSGVYPIARALSVDYGALRRRVAEAVGVRTEGAGAHGFVELSGAQLLGAAAATGPVVELCRRDDLRLTIRLGAGETLDIAALVQSFGQLDR